MNEVNMIIPEIFIWVKKRNIVIIDKMHEIPI